MMNEIQKLISKRTTYKPFEPTDDSQHQAFAKATVDLVIDEFIDDLKQLKENQPESVEIKKKNRFDEVEYVGGDCICENECYEDDNYCGGCGAKIKRVE